MGQTHTSSLGPETRMRGEQLSPSSADNIQRSQLAPWDQEGRQDAPRARQTLSTGRGRESSSDSQQAGHRGWHFPASVMVPSQAELAVSQPRSGVPRHCTPCPSSSSSFSVLSRCGFSDVFLLSPRVRRLAHSSPKAP